MSATITDYGRGQLLQAYFQSDLLTWPADLYLAYTRTIPVANSDGTQLDEPTSGYARTLIGPLDSSTWGWTGFSEMYNLNDFAFADPTADWGLVVGWAVLDSVTVGAGNCLAVGAVVEPFQVLNGDAGPAVGVGGVAFGLYD